MSPEQIRLLSPPAHRQGPQWLPLPLKYAALDLRGLLGAGLCQLLPSSVSVFLFDDAVPVLLRGFAPRVRRSLLLSGPGRNPGAGCI